MALLWFPEECSTLTLDIPVDVPLGIGDNDKGNKSGKDDSDGKGT